MVAYQVQVACTNVIEDHYGNKQMCNVKLDEACLVNRYGQTIEAVISPFAPSLFSLIFLPSSSFFSFVGAFKW